MSKTIYNPSHKYINWYLKLIRYRLSAPPKNTYSEKHHIFPKSIFGPNNIIVSLTAREHFVAHKLLYKICQFRYGNKHSNTFKMLRAISYMSSREDIKCNSRMYAECRTAQSLVMMGENNPSVKYGFSEEHRKKLSEAGKGRGHAEEHKENQRLAWARRIARGDTAFSIETRNKTIESNKQNAKRFNFIHDSGIEEFNMSALELVEKYKDMNLVPSHIRGSTGCNTLGYIKHRGWRINTGEPECIKSRKIDSRTLRKSPVSI